MRFAPELVIKCASLKYTVKAFTVCCLICRKPVSCEWYCIGKNRIGRILPGTYPPVCFHSPDVRAYVASLERPQHAKCHYHIGVVAPGKGFFAICTAGSSWTCLNTLPGARQKPSLTRFPSVCIHIGVCIGNEDIRCAGNRVQKAYEHSTGHSRKMIFSLRRSCSTLILPNQYVEDREKLKELLAIIEVRDSEAMKVFLTQVRIYCIRWLFRLHINPHNLRIWSQAAVAVNRQGGDLSITSSPSVTSQKRCIHHPDDVLRQSWNRFLPF